MIPLKILILSRRASYYSTRRLVEAARAAGHTALVADPLQCIITTDKLQLTTLYPKHTTPNARCIDAVIPRIGNIAIEYSLAIVKHFELAGVPVVNSAESIYLAKDKFLSLQLLHKRGLTVPATLMLRSPHYLKAAVRQLGGLPVVVKLLRGSQGIGVQLVRTMKQLNTIVKSTWSVDHDCVLQQYLPEAQGQDIRVLILGNRVIAAMRRYPPKGDFRSNIHQGGKGETIALPSAYCSLAKQAAKALGLRMAGVDLMETKDGPVIIEVNASPGFEGLEQVTGENIAGQIIDFTAALTRRN